MSLRATAGSRYRSVAAGGSLALNICLLLLATIDKSHRLHNIADTHIQRELSQRQPPGTLPPPQVSGADATSSELTALPVRSTERAPRLQPQPDDEAWLSRFRTWQVRP